MTREYSLDEGRTWQPVYVPPPGPIFRDAVTKAPRWSARDPGPLLLEPQVRIYTPAPRVSLRPLVTWALILLLIGVLFGVVLDRVAIAATSIPFDAAHVAQAAQAPELAPVSRPDGSVSGMDVAGGGAGSTTAAVETVTSTTAPSTTSIASWYGPGFYGNTTACGQTYTPELAGVAHRTLACGRLVGLAYGDRIVFVHVVDRGPFVDGRVFDLTNATRLALGCTDLCPVRWWLP